MKIKTASHVFFSKMQLTRSLFDIQICGKPREIILPLISPIPILKCEAI